MNWDVSLDNEEYRVGDALVGLYRIRTDLEHSEEETPHCHSYYELHLVIRGEYSYNIDYKDVFVHEGEMVLIRPDVLHKAVIPGKNVEVSVLSISVKKCAEGQGVYAPLIKCLDAHSSVSVGQGPLLLALLSAFDKLCQSPDLIDLFRRKEISCRIMTEILLSFGFNEQDCPTSELMNFDIMLETLVRNSKMPLHEIAERIGYSQRQTSRIIKERYGMSFAQLRRGNK